MDRLTYAVKTVVAFIYKSRKYYEVKKSRAYATLPQCVITTIGDSAKMRVDWSCSVSSIHKEHPFVKGSDKPHSWRSVIHAAAG
jgi:hypothetical protein